MDDAEKPTAISAKSAPIVRGRPFEPGQSGNPSGRPKLAQEVRELLKPATPKACEKLILALEACDKDGNPDWEMQVKAANALLDRVIGKPSQAITGEDGEKLFSDNIDLLSLFKKLAEGDK